MLDLEGIKNQIRYFECLDAAVSAYKMMADGEAKSFYEAIKKQNKIPLINSIPGSNVLLANHVLKTATSRFSFMLLIREEKTFIKFDKIQKQDKYISIRDKILENDPCLTQAECDKILNQITNAIAHGDILSSLDFKLYEDTLNRIYTHSRSLNATHPDMEKIYYDGHIASSVLKFNYETYFDLLPDGTRIKKNRPVKKQLKLTHDDIANIVYMISDHTETMNAAYYMDKNNIVVIDLANNTETEYPLDEIQKEAMSDLYNFYKIKLEKHLNKELSSKLANTLAMPKILFGEKFAYLKIRELCDVGTAISKGLQQTKRGIDEIQNYMSNVVKNYLDKAHIYQAKNAEIVSKELSYYIRPVLNNEIENLYKNYLIVEIATMLQIIEQNELKRKVGNSPIIREIAAEYYEKEEFTDKEIIKIIDHIRDAFIHGTYINNVEDKIEIYDQITRTDKTLEYKFTVYNDDLEQLKTACMSALKERESQLQPASNLRATLNTEPERTL